MIKLISHLIRKKVLRSNRVDRLSQIYSDIIGKKKEKVKILDFGSGYDASLVLNLIKILETNKISYEIDCFDFYNENQIKKLNSLNENLSFYNLEDFQKIINTKKEKYDYSILSDVLHHVGVKNLDEINKILNYLKSSSYKIILKDHYANSFIDTLLLKIIDFIGNYGTGTNIPENYFSQKSLNEILIRNNLQIILKKENVRVQSKFYLILSKPSLNFIYLLKVT